MKLLATVTLIMLISSVWGKSMAAEFADGPIIFGYGKHTPVQQDIMLKKETLLRWCLMSEKLAKMGPLIVVLTALHDF